MTSRYLTFATAFGPFSVSVDESGALTATAFGSSDQLKPRLPKGTELIPDKNRLTTEAKTQITAYLSGKRNDFSLPLNPTGTAFQKRVWQSLNKIPRGQTSTYGELAKKLVSSPRAVGRANATNPICLVTPCHRVIGANGSLTGFAFGTEIKARLLALESA